jgi:hypothetical protein
MPDNPAFTKNLSMVERRTPCISTLLTVERIHPARPHYRWWKGIHSAKYRVLTVEGDKPCMSTLLAM